MRRCGATLWTTEVELGWPLTNDSVQPGRRYVVDLDRVARCWLVNDELGRGRQTVLGVRVGVLEPTPPGWLPLFALALDTETRH